MNRNLNATHSVHPGAFPAGSVTPLYTHLSRFGNRVWLSLQRYGQRRAAEQLRLLAVQYTHTNPELARRLKSASDEYRSVTS
jgi:hypothetical protein